jgi:NAD(P)-dependent dehydrogenase (short-subunit alcohol dehydrogenase family)
MFPIISMPLCPIFLASPISPTSHSNVGLSQPGTPSTMTEEIWDAQMAVNLKSAYLLTHHILPIMTAQPPLPTSPTTRAAIINTSSIAALRYLSKPQIAYSTSKAGLLAFTRTTAAMYASDGVRVNCVVPGLMHTPLIQSLAEKYEGGDLEKLVRKREGSVPLGRMGNGFDVAYATCFLASEAARYVTGQKLVVDGGVVGCAAPG